MFIICLKSYKLARDYQFVEKKSYILRYGPDMAIEGKDARLLQ